MIEAGHSGHLGGAMSAIDIITALYFDVLNIDPARPDRADRDRFLLSAGHKAMGQYAVLAERGFFDKSTLDTYGAMKTALGGHPDMHKLPGVEGNTGALGHGLSISVGMALGLRLAGAKARVFTRHGRWRVAGGLQLGGRGGCCSSQGRQAGGDRRQQRHANQRTRRRGHEHGTDRRQVRGLRLVQPARSMATT